MKKLTLGKIWLFGIGQFGWALLSGLIATWLVYFYQPNQIAQDAGQILYIPQGRVVLGIITIIGAITALGRVFDAVTDPWIASLSDRCKSKNGRRIPFLKMAAFPLAAATVAVFFAPVQKTSWINAVWLLIMILIYYLAITTYCTPYTALIPELGHSQKDRMTISTVISLTFIVGTALAYSASIVWGALEPVLGRVIAMRLTICIYALIAFVCMLVPVFAIREKDYVDVKPVEGTAFSSLVKTFQNPDFRVFVGSDILYWIGLTMFQTGLPFFVTSLLKLPENMAFIYFALMTAMSLVFYIPINIITRKIGKKNLVLFAFFTFAATYTYTFFLGEFLPIDPLIQGYILAIVAALPMAIFGILPQAMVADISQSDSILTGENREGMFYAARTFAFKLGQSISMLLFTAVATIGLNGMGYRIAAGIAAVFCLGGGIILFAFNENKINGIIKDAVEKELK